MNEVLNMQIKSYADNAVRAGLQSKNPADISRLIGHIRGMVQVAHWIHPSWLLPDLTMHLKLLEARQEWADEMYEFMQFDTGRPGDWAQIEREIRTKHGE